MLIYFFRLRLAAGETIKIYCNSANEADNGAETEDVDEE